MSEHDNERPKVFMSNELVLEGIARVHEGVKSQTGAEAIFGSIHLVMIRLDGAIALQIINKCPDGTFDCALNVASIQRDFSSWLLSVVTAQHGSDPHNHDEPR